MRILNAVRPLYNRWLRERLPREYAVVQGDIVTRHRRLLDISRYHDDYERTESDALRAVIKPGDHVLILGGGFGVTSVVASRATGAEGRVTVYEAVPEMAEICIEAVRINHTPSVVTVRTAAVETVTNATHEGFGSPSESVSAADLPDADVLSLDVEGAELDILRAIDLPSRVICGVHPGLVDEDAVLAALPDPVTVRRKTETNKAESPYIAIAGTEPQ